MKTTVRLAFAAMMLVLIAACGQKGPLYLPDEGGEVVTRPASGGQTQAPENAPQPSTQTPTPTKPEDQKKQTPR